MFKQVAIGLCLLFYSTSWATHIVGGEMTYSYIGNNQYAVKLKLYIDCYNGSSSAIASDRYALISVFDGDSGKILNQYCQSVLRGNPFRVSKTNYNCIKISPNACVDAYEYNTTFTLPPRKGGYYLSFQRCCRNRTINNLSNPSSLGETIWTKINDTTQIGYNSSPEFKNLPPNFLCTNTPIVIDHSATDADGDSLAYEFFHPYNGANIGGSLPDCKTSSPPPFPLVTYNPGYNMLIPIPSSPNINLNSKTGQLKLTPSIPGQYVVGILVKEFRKGKYIGATRRDYQFNIQDCVFETTSAFVAPNVNCNREVFFTNYSQNATAYHWDFGDSSIKSDTSNTKLGYYKYKSPGTYKIKLIASNSNCADSFENWITVLDKIYFSLPKDIFYCGQGQQTIQPDTFYKKAQYLWSDGSKDSILKINGPGRYWLKVTLGNCTTNDSINITSDDLKIDLLADTLVCLLDSNRFKGQLTLSGSTDSIRWYRVPNTIPLPSTDSILSINRSGKYLAKGIKSNGCPFADTIVINDWKGKAWLKPINVFTPNGDQTNDVFPEPHPPYHYHLQIFDRWGIEIFKAYDQAWDGGQFPDGAYYFFIEMEACGQKEKAHGVLRIIH